MYIDDGNHPSVTPLVTKHFVFEFFDESSYRGAMWSLNRTPKISGQYHHSIPRYINFNFFGFLTVHYYF